MTDEATWPLCPIHKLRYHVHHGCALCRIEGWTVTADPTPHSDTQPELSDWEGEGGAMYEPAGPGYPPESEPPQYKTRSGKILTDEDIQRLADEAERGYDPKEFRQRKREQVQEAQRRLRTMAEVYHSHSGRARQIWSLVTWRYVVVALVVGFVIGSAAGRWLP